MINEHKFRTNLCSMNEKCAAMVTTTHNHLTSKASVDRTKLFCDFHVSIEVNAITDIIKCVCVSANLCEKEPEKKTKKKKINDQNVAMRFDTM